MTITVPLAVRGKLRQAARTAAGATVAQVVLSAIEHHAGNLSGLIEAEKPQGRPGTGLFPDPAAARPTRGTDEPRGPLTIRMTAANLAVIDQLQVDHHADTRSQLITAALRAELAHLDLTGG